MKGQDSIGEISLTLAPDLYLPGRVKAQAGTICPELLPSCSGHLEIGWRFWNTQNRSWHVNYLFGVTTWRISNQLSKEQFPILRNDVQSVYWGRARYHSIGLSCQWSLDAGNEFRVALANRFYVSGHNGFSIGSYYANTQTHLTVFRTDAYTPNSYFNPELNLSYARPFWKKLPSFKAVLLLSISPRSVFTTSYTYFPDDGQYTSTGSFYVMQSYLSIGIRYQRVVRD